MWYLMNTRANHSVLNVFTANSSLKRRCSGSHLKSQPMRD